MFEALRRRIFGAVETAPSTPPEPAAPVTMQTGWYKPDVNDRFFLTSGMDITPEQILSYVRLAETGETRYLHAFYEEMVSRDTHISAELGKQVALILGARRDVLPMPKKLRKKSLKEDSDAKIAQDAAEYVEAQLSSPSIGFGKAIEHLCRSRYTSISVLEVVVLPGMAAQGREKLIGLNPVPNQRLRLKSNSTEWEVRIGENEWIDLAVLQAAGAVIVMRYEDHVPSPARRGLFRRMVAPYLMRTQGPGWWGRFVELFGMPIRVAEVPADQNRAASETQGKFENQGAAGFFTLPPGAKMQLLEAAKGDAPHERFIEWASKEITKLVHGATQGTDIQKGQGSQASTEQHVDLMKLVAQGLAVEVAESLVKQLVEGLVARNFGQDVADEHTPELRVWVVEQGDLLALAEIIAKLKSNGLKTIPTDWVHDRFQIPIPDEDDEVLGESDLLPGLPGQVIPFPGQQPGGPRRMPMPNQGGPTRGGAQGEPGEAAQLIRELDAVLLAHMPENTATGILSEIERKAAAEAYDAGREMLKPYVAIIEQAEKEELPLAQLLSRIMHRFYARPGTTTAQLRDVLAAVIADAELRGIRQVRQTRLA